MIGWIKARRKWVLEKRRLRELREKLMTDLADFPKEAPAIFDYSVKFLNAISEFEDGGDISHAPERLSDSQSILNKCIAKLGRNETSVNRTKKGEEVTLENTYWGDRFGLRTHTSKFWRDNTMLFRESDGNWLDLSRYKKDPLCSEVIADFQIRRLILNNRSIILDSCNKLLGIKNRTLRK